MVAVAASPTPGAASAGPIASRTHNHPPYKDMILSAIMALKEGKGSSHRAISKYIADKFSDLPTSHDALLVYHLRRLCSEGVLIKLKLSYKIAQSPTAGKTQGTRKPGRPRKTTDSSSGRPSKVIADTAVFKKKKRGRPAKTTAMSPLAVYLLPRSEHRKSGLLRGAAAIVLPQGLVSGIVNFQNSEGSVNPVLILPNGVQSLLNVSGKRNQETKKKKKRPGRPRKMEVKHAVQPRKKIKLQNHDGSVHAVNGVTNSVAKRPGRPRKTWNFFQSKNAMTVPANTKAIPNSGGQAILGITGLVTKKRPVGRPRKRLLTEVSNLPIREQGVLDTAEERVMLDNGLEVKKRSVGRPRKRLSAEGSSLPRPNFKEQGILEAAEELVIPENGLDVKKRPVDCLQRRLFAEGSNPAPSNFRELDGVSETAEAMPNNGEVATTSTLEVKKRPLGRLSASKEVKKRSVGRPRRGSVDQSLKLVPLAVISEQGMLKASKSSEVKKRVGRPRKIPLVEGANVSHPAIATCGTNILISH